MCTRRNKSTNLTKLARGARAFGWRVAASLIRHGGLKSGKPIPPTEINGRVKQLRDQAKTEEEAKPVEEAKVEEAKPEEAKPVEEAKPEEKEPAEEEKPEEANELAKL